jgi:hypothetical protein
LNINPRGRELLEHLEPTDIEILNQGEEPTIHTEKRQEIIDLTLCSRELVDTETTAEFLQQVIVSSHEMQGNKDVDASTREGSSSPFLGHKPAI